MADHLLPAPLGTGISAAVNGDSSDGGTGTLVNEGGCRSSSLRFQRQSSAHGLRARGNASRLHLPPWGGGGGGPSLPNAGSRGRGAGMRVCVTAWQEPRAHPCTEMCTCLHDSLGCYLLLSRNIKMLRLLGPQISACKMYPKGQPNPSPLKSESRPATLGSLQCKHGMALLGGYCFPPGKGNQCSKPLGCWCGWYDRVWGNSEQKP